YPAGSQTRLWAWAALDIPGWWDALSGRERLLFSSLALIAVLLAGAMLIYLTDRWRRRLNSKTTGDVNQQLSTFRELYERGELSREEFERIREKLTGRLRQELEKAAPTENSAETASRPGPETDEKPPPPASIPPTPPS